MDYIHKQEFRIRDLPTRSVSLFPAQAQVVRDVKDVVLKPGANQITIVGFTPTIDENSIKVEGTGQAVVSDIAVELLPNREIYDDIYPESDEDDMELDDDDEDDDDDGDEKKKESTELKEVRGRLTALRDEEKVAREVTSSAESRLRILDAYGKMLDRKRDVEIDAGLETYRTQRARVFQDHMEGVQKTRALTKTIAEVVAEEGRLLRLQEREDRKAARIKSKAALAKQKERRREAERRAEKRQEKLRIRREREKLWPRQCYTVRITLDAAGYTPASSRRTSVASIAELARPVALGVAAAGKGEEQEGDDVDVTAGVTCDLAISYVTTSAFWSPTYDLQLSTTTGSAVLCFDASMTNKTSETWSSCKVVLSTSQTTFSGLNDAIPLLQPWRVKLDKTGAHHAGSPGLDGIISSREELAHKSSWAAGKNGSKANTAADQRQRHGLFGAPPPPLPAVSFRKMEEPIERVQQQQIQQQQQQQIQQQMQQYIPQTIGWGSNNTNANASTGSAFGTTSGALFGAAPPPPPPLQAAPAAASFPRTLRRMEGTSREYSKKHGSALLIDSDDDDDDDDEDTDDNGTMVPGAAPELEFQESALEETGLTTTYDLPGLKTLASSATASRQRVARISLPAGAVLFSHTIVAKYKPAAYLKARIKNASKLTLLRGPAGLTLDGAFLGRTTLPRCSAGDSFSLSLGVDPAIRVAYPKPDVKRAAGGSLFSKDSTGAFHRSITVTNTHAASVSGGSGGRSGSAAAAAAAAATATATAATSAAAANKPATLLVLDQVPVSEDEKLRVDLQHPRGLSVDGPSVAAGQGVAVGLPSSGGTAAPKDWGRAAATLKKAGQITWDVQLNPGRTVRLDLEYTVTVPVGEAATQC